MKVLRCPGPLVYWYDAGSDLVQKCWRRRRTIRAPIPRWGHQPGEPRCNCRVIQVNPGSRRGDHQVGHGETDDVDVGRRAQTLTAPDRRHDETVSNQRQRYHQWRHADLSSSLQWRHRSIGLIGIRKTARVRLWHRDALHSSPLLLLLLPAVIWHHQLMWLPRQEMICNIKPSPTARLSDYATSVGFLWQEVINDVADIVDCHRCDVTAFFRGFGSKPRLLRVYGIEIKTKTVMLWSQDENQDIIFNFFWETVINKSELNVGPIFLTRPNPTHN